MTSQPCCCSNAATTEESTPPDIATTTRRGREAARKDDPNLGGDLSSGSDLTSAIGRSDITRWEGAMGTCWLTAD